MFTFVISLVVVGAALFFATQIAIGEAPERDKPATRVTRSVGGRQRAVRADALATAAGSVETQTAWHRFRSAVLLIAIVTALGALAALVLVVFGAIVLNGLRTAVQ